MDSLILTKQEVDSSSMLTSFNQTSSVIEPSELQDMEVKIEEFTCDFGASSIRTPVITDVKPLPCKSKFEQRALLASHQKVNTEKKLFHCSICNKIFGSKSNLVLHQKIHTGEKLFQCSICNKNFGRKSQLASYQIIHTGEKLFQCNICDKRFG